METFTEPDPAERRALNERRLSLLLSSSPRVPPQADGVDLDPHGRRSTAAATVGGAVKYRGRETLPALITQCPAAKTNPNDR